MKSTLKKNLKEMMIMRYSSARFVVFLVALTCMSCQQFDPEDAPNILMIMCDDLGWGDVGFNGNTTIQTPHLDALAASGIIFDRFYAASAVCSPTRASCITGRNPMRMNIPTANAGHLPIEENTIAEILQGEGYRTAHFGKWHLGTLSKKLRDSNRGGRPENAVHYPPPTWHGYDRFFCTEAKVPTYDPMLRPITFDSAQGESLRYGWKAHGPATAIEPYGTYYWDGDDAPVDVNLNGPNSRIIMDQALKFIRERKDQPFYATIWFHTPHLPLVADSAARASYAQLTLEEQLHHASITAMDFQMGRLVEALEDLECLDNTWIWFCSDNGPENRTPGSSGPFRERKRSLYEGGVRVPAFAVGPEIHAPGTHLDFPIMTSDYLPTVMDHLDLPAPNTHPLDGISVARVLNGELQERSPMGFLFQKKQSLVTEQYKLISIDGGQTFELYDLLSDHAETTNLIEVFPEVAAKMRQELYAWIASCEASAKSEDYH